MLSKQGYNVWWDIELLPGQKFADEINSLIKTVKAVVVLWTSESIQSDWVKAETSLAMERGILIPIWLEKIDLPAPYNTLNTLDLSQWDGSPEEPLLDSLLASTKALAGQSATPQKLLDDLELNSVLDEPRHEAEFWTSISLATDQSVEAFQLYTDKYGENGTFYSLARLRINSILAQKKSEKHKKKIQLITTVGVVAGISAGVLLGLQILDKIPKKEVENSVTNIRSTKEITKKTSITNKPINIKIAKIKIDRILESGDVEFIQVTRSTYGDQGTLMYCRGWTDEQVDLKDLTFRPDIGMPCTSSISKGKTVNHVRIFVKYKGLKRFAYLNGDQLIALKGIITPKGSDSIEMYNLEIAK